MKTAVEEINPIKVKWRRRPKLTGRDEKILSLLGEYGCVSAERIKAYFWNSTSTSRAHYRRLGVLRRRGLVENTIGDRAMTIGYRLTKRGKEVLRNSPAANLRPANRRAYKTQFEHDQYLIDLRRILQESPIVKEFKTEAEVRKQLIDSNAKLLHWENLPHIPDATFSLVMPGQTMRVALEVELTLKNKKRYAKIFRNHLLARTWEMVIYVVKDANFRDRLMATLNDIKSTDIQVRVASKINGIYFCTIGEFLSRRLEVPMTNGKKEISLAKIAENFGLTPKPSTPPPPQEQSLNVLQVGNSLRNEFKGD